MKPLKVGKLYSCSKYFLLLYPDKEAAAAAGLACPIAAAAYAASWSKTFGKPASFCDPETPLLVLSVKEEYIQVLAGYHKGWIINEDYLNIKELISKAA